MLEYLTFVISGKFYIFRCSYQNSCVIIFDEMISSHSLQQILMSFLNILDVLCTTFSTNQLSWIGIHYYFQ